MPNHSAPPSDLEVILYDTTEEDRLACARFICPGFLVAGRATQTDLSQPLAGRVPSAYLMLPRTDRNISRKHFSIELAPTFCRLTNYSDLGTFVNNLLVQTECELRFGDLIRVGNSTVWVEVRQNGSPFAHPVLATAVWNPIRDTTLPVEGGTPPPPPPAAVPPIAPLQIPGYRLVRPLGSGGMGTVWLAEDQAGELAACKVIRPDLALDQEACARFRRETLLLHDLRHPYIVGFRAAGEVQGLLYLAMDYVPGRNLADVLREQGPFAVGRAVRLVCQVLEALAHAHGAGVVHRDVKPSNILVLDGPTDEEVRLADFGLAKAYKATDVGAALTLPGVMAGTLAFTAPDQVSDFRGAGPLADQYAAAATLYNLLTDCYPHDARTGLELLDCIRANEAVPLSQRRSGLPADLPAAIHRALARDPKNRFPTIKSFREVLLPFADCKG